MTVCVKYPALGLKQRAADMFNSWELFSPIPSHSDLPKVDGQVEGNAGTRPLSPPTPGHLTAF